MEGKTVLLEKRDKVAIITLNRPEKLNALTMEMRLEFLDILDNLRVDDEVRVIVVTGAGRAFCAGADISQMGQGGEDAIEWKKQQFRTRVVNMVKQIYEFEKPFIGAINGICYGDGSQWLLAFDLNVASEKAQIAWATVKLGLLCPYGVMRLPGEIGRFRAKELNMTGRPLSAEEAYQWGLVNKVVPHEKLIDAALELANEIAKMPPLSIRAIKQAVNRGIEGYEYCFQVSANLALTDDFKEGRRAFMEKRQPNFQGK